MRVSSTSAIRWTTCLALALWGGSGCVDLLPGQPADASLATDTGNDTSAAVVVPAVDQSQEIVSSDLPECVNAGEPATPVHRAMFEALNQYREENGLPPLIYSRTLEAAADGQVRDLWERGFFAHVNPDGKNPGQRAVAAGFCHQYVGENIAAGQKSIDAVMTAWKNSPGHNANMLEPLYVYVGVSYSVDANGRYYWGQEFAYELP